MAGQQGPRVGTVAWWDLTVEDAPGVRDFYRKVVGWEARDVDMGEYSDFEMLAAGGSAAGICHARGVNADLPPVWLPYVVVEDLDAAVSAAESEGGEVVAPTRAMGGARMAVIRDPAGAACALYEAPS